MIPFNTIGYRKNVIGPIVTILNPMSAIVAIHASLYPFNMKKPTAIVIRPTPRIQMNSVIPPEMLVK